MSLNFNTCNIGGAPQGSGSITPTGTIAINENGDYNVTNYANASVNVPTTEPTLSSLTITPSTTAQTITPSDTDGYGTVTVSAVTASIDADIQASNIKSGVDILGVTGNLTALVGETTTITQNGTYSPTTGNGFTSVSVDVSGGGSGGQTVMRGDWIVPQAYLDLDSTTKEYYTTYNPTCAVGIYLDKSKLNNNTYSYNHSSIGVNNIRVFAKNGEKTKSTSSFSSYWTSVTLDSDEDWLVILCSASGMGFDELMTTVCNGNISTNNNIGITPLHMATKYIAYCGELSNGYAIVDTAIWSNLDEIHPVYPYTLMAKNTFLQQGNGFKYIPSTTECNYTSLPNVSNVIKNISLLPNLPDGADFSSQTNAWDFSLNINSFDYYSKFINLSRMYIALPNANVTFNGSMSNANTQGIHLTPENWTYIAEHAPAVSGKTITIDKYNEDALGSTNKATLQSKGWTVTVISS